MSKLTSHPINNLHYYKLRFFFKATRGSMDKTHIAVAASYTISYLFPNYSMFLLGDFFGNGEIANVTLLLLLHFRGNFETT